MHCWIRQRIEWRNILLTKIHLTWKVRLFGEPTAGKLLEVLENPGTKDKVDVGVCCF